MALESDEKRKKAEELFQRALDVAPEGRKHFVEAQCTDARVRAEVEELLDLDGGVAGTFLERPLADGAAIGRIGPYRILRQLGEGGFGTVYLAEQLEPLRREVALKVLNPGMDSRKIIARFEAERQTLAWLDHPNVARVLEAGADERGRPYFVMEYVPGEPITVHADRARLPVADRATLFLQVCEAIQHAHQKGVIHRDVKPSNVLVQRIDGRSVVKVIDFGIAKAIDPASAPETLLTTAGQVVGTPEYMSPEQAGSRGGIDTRTDIYSLGVLLYELLTGVLPLDPAVLRSGGLVDALQAIRDLEPPRPSTRFGRLGSAAAELALKRRADPAVLLRELRGDLDWIVMKAIEKEPARRYVSVSELAKDLGSYLRSETVSATPPSAAYKLRKFLRRNRALAWAGSLVLAALLLGIAGTSLGLFRARRERAIAERRFDDARRLARTLIFDVHDRIRNLNGATAAREFLVKTSLPFYDALALDAAGDPDLQAELAEVYLRLGDIQGNPFDSNLGDIEGALRSYERSLSIARALVSGGPGEFEARRTLAAARNKIGQVQTALGRTSEALENLSAAVAVSEDLARERPADEALRRDVAWNRRWVGDVQAKLGRTQEAIGSLETAIGVLDASWNRTPSAATAEGLATAWTDLAGLLAKAKQPEKAHEAIQKALEWGEKLPPGEGEKAQVPRRIGSRFEKLGNILVGQSRHEEALDAYRRMARVLEDRLRLDPADTRARWDRSIAHMKVGEMQAMLNRIPEAMESYGEARALRLALSAADPANRQYRRGLMECSSLIADLHTARKEIDAALDLYRESLDAAERLAAADPGQAIAQRDVAISLLKLAEACEEKAAKALEGSPERIERLGEAIAYYRRSLAKNRERKERGILDPDGAIIEDIEKAIAACEGKMPAREGTP